MLRAFNRRGQLGLGSAGVSSLEFAVIAALFFIMLIGSMDLGRYYLVEHSLSTMVAETARYALTHPSLQGSNIDPTTVPVTTITPFVDTAGLTNLSVLQSLGMPGTNQISVSATYQFSAFSPIWNALNGPITETTKLQF